MHISMYSLNNINEIAFENKMLIHLEILNKNYFIHIK